MHRPRWLPPDPQPVRGSIDFSADHHHYRKLGRRDARKPRRRQIHELTAVPKLRSLRANGDRNHDTLGRHLTPAPHRGQGGAVGLIGQRTRGQLAPRGVHRRDVSDPRVEDQSAAEQAQQCGQYRRSSPPTSYAAPADHNNAAGQPRQCDPPPQCSRRRFAGQARCSDVPMQPHRQPHTQSRRERHP